MSMPTVSREVVMIVGYPASGEGTLAQEFDGYERLNRDERGDPPLSQGRPFFEMTS